MYRLQTFIWTTGARIIKGVSRYMKNHGLYFVYSMYSLIVHEYSIHYIFRTIDQDFYLLQTR
jgi:hypothetical protein